MTKATVLGLGLGLMAGLAASAHAQTYMELEHARANARAGGPVSADEAELLERYGCLSGTRSAFCERLEGKQRRPARKPRKRVRN